MALKDTEQANKYVCAHCSSEVNPKTGIYERRLVGNPEEIKKTKEDLEFLESLGDKSKYSSRYGGYSNYGGYGGGSYGGYRQSTYGYDIYDEYDDYDDYYNEDSPKKGVAEIILAKHRGGSIGTIELLWLGNYTKFVDLDKRDM